MQRILTAIFPPKIPRVKSAPDLKDAEQELLKAELDKTKEDLAKVKDIIKILELKTEKSEADLYRESNTFKIKNDSLTSEI